MIVTPRPTPSHPPEPPTVEDLREHGPAACLAALREEFDGAHRRYPQYRGWTAGTTLGVARRRIGGGSTYVRAEPGDLVLVKRDRAGAPAGMYPADVAYVPRVCSNVGIGLCEIEEIPVPKASSGT